MSSGGRHGYTTGACAAAAAKGAALLLTERRIAGTVSITLPGGEVVLFALHGASFDDDCGRCFVIKDAGDDPDVTNGCEIWAEVSLCEGGEIALHGGTGIGRVTKPGLAVAVGEWAINPVPRRMIIAALREVFPDQGVKVTLSIPDGALRAERTLNSRLGIIGGLSILGTTGIVKPISHKAWTDTIEASLDVACACGEKTVILSTGRSSEMIAQQVLERCGLNPGEEAFIMMGDHVGYALRACARRPVDRVIIAGQFAKLLKIACRHEQTHVSQSRLDLQQLQGWLAAGDFPGDLIELAGGANTAREVLAAAEEPQALAALISSRAQSFAEMLAAPKTVEVFLAGYDGEVLYFLGSDQIRHRIMAERDL